MRTVEKLLFLAAAAVVVGSYWAMQQKRSDLFSEVGRYQIVEIEEGKRDVPYNGTTYLLDTKTGIIFKRTPPTAGFTSDWIKDTENAPPLNLYQLNEDILERSNHPSLKKLADYLNDPAQTEKSTDNREFARSNLYRIMRDVYVSEEDKNRARRILEDDRRGGQYAKDQEQLGRILEEWASKNQVNSH